MGWLARPVLVPIIRYPPNYLDGCPGSFAPAVQRRGRVALLNTSSGPCRREPCFVGWNAETRWASFELDCNLDVAECVFVSSIRGRSARAVC